MTSSRKCLRVIGQLGLLGALAVGGFDGIAWAGITVVMRTEPAAQTAPNTTALPAQPSAAAARNSHDADSSNVTKRSKDESTVKARLLAILLTLFEGRRGAAP